MNAMAEPALTSTTQAYLDIHDVTHDIVILKDGSAAMVISVDAINFALLAEAEQDGIIYAYAGLLNSLNYPIQILIRSQTKDVSNYLHLLDQQEEEATARLKKAQIRQYRDFVANLIQERNVLDKKFYVVIPVSALELGLISAQSVVPGVKSSSVAEFERSVIVERAHNNLDPKRDHLIGQFARIGLYARQLTTQEIIQLFYVSYNPEAAEGQKITDSNSYTTPVVQARVLGATMADQPQGNQPGTTPPMGQVAPNPTAPADMAPPPVTVSPAMADQMVQTTPNPIEPAESAAPAPTAMPAAPSVTPPPPSTEPLAPAMPSMPPTPLSPMAAPSMMTPPTQPAPAAPTMTPPLEPGNPTQTPPQPVAPAPAAAAPTPGANPSSGPGDSTVAEAQAAIEDSLKAIGGTDLGTVPTPGETPAGGGIPPQQPVTSSSSATPAAGTDNTDALPPLPEI